MKLLRSNPFLKMYAKLPAEIQKKVDRRVIYLAEDIYHPALYTRKMTGFDDIWEARIDNHYRLTFQVQDDVIILRRVGTHEIYRKP